MDKEKLEKAARQFRESVLRKDIDVNPNKTWDENLRPYKDSFKQGAEWLMGQPMKDKLSEDDKKSLRELYACYKQHEAVCKEKGLYEAELIAKGSTATMRDIFGKEMFLNKE